MKRRLALVCAAMLAESACQNLPEPFAPPVQRHPAEDIRTAAIVSMSDEDAGAHIVGDITSIQTPTWRWTGKRPTVRVRMQRVENLRYTIDFVIPQATLDAVGPVTVTFLVDDRALGSAHYDRVGSQHFERAVPEGWVMPKQDVTVAAEIDKVWFSAEDRTQLGMLLVRIGLTQ